MSRLVKGAKVFCSRTNRDAIVMEVNNKGDGLLPVRYAGPCSLSIYNSCDGHAVATLAEGSFIVVYEEIKDLMVRPSTPPVFASLIDTGPGQPPLDFVPPVSPERGCKG